MTDVLLRPPAERVAPSARWYWALRALAGWAVLAGVEVLAWWIDGGNGAIHAAILAVTVAFALGHVIVMPQWRYRVHRWEATDTAVYTQTGWFDQERRIAPVARIQTVDVERGPLEQAFGLANVTVTTASAAGPLTIHGLTRDGADALAAALTARAQHAGGDAT